MQVLNAQARAFCQENHELGQVVLAEKLNEQGYTLKSGKPVTVCSLSRWLCHGYSSRRKRRRLRSDFGMPRQKKVQEVDQLSKSAQSLNLVSTVIGLSDVAPEAKLDLIRKIVCH